MIARVGLIGVGVAAIGWGARGLIGSAGFGDLVSAATWFVGGALLSDAVLAPTTIIVGVLVTRLVPTGSRPYVQSGLIITAGVTLVALPLLSGRGKKDTNPSALPLNYWHGWLITLGCVWAAIILIAAVRWFIAVRGNDGSANARTNRSR